MAGYTFGRSIVAKSVYDPFATRSSRSAWRREKRVGKVGLRFDFGALDRQVRHRA
jgi:hypothetical protein